MWFLVTKNWYSISNSRNRHQTIPAIKFQAEGVRAVADEQWCGLLACLLAAHAIGVTDAMVAGHKGGGDGVGICRDVYRNVSPTRMYITI